MRYPLGRFMNPKDIPDESSVPGTSRREFLARLVGVPIPHHTSQPPDRSADAPPAGKPVGFRPKEDYHA